MPQILQSLDTEAATLILQSFDQVSHLIKGLIGRSRQHTAIAGQMPEAHATGGERSSPRHGSVQGDDRRDVPAGCAESENDGPSCEKRARWRITM